MTADNLDIQQVDSRRSSVSSLRGSRHSNSSPRRAHSTPVPPAPAGPRSPHRVGSSYTRYSVIPPALSTSPETSTKPEGLGETPRQSETDNAMSIQVEPVATPESAAEEIPIVEAYRSPEAVIEADEPPWTGTGLPPGVIAEHIGDDPSDNTWMEYQNEELPAYDMPPHSPPLEKSFGLASERPQIGPGVMAKRWFEELHEHKVYQPVFTTLPRPLPPRPKTPPPAQPSTLAVAADGAPTSLVTPLAPLETPYPPPLTIDNVLESLPGGKEHHDEWYFCPECWGWLRIVVRQDQLPPLQPLNEWESVKSWSPERRDEEHLAALQEKNRLNDLLAAGQFGDKTVHHFHKFDKLVEPSSETRIDRIVAEGIKEDFAHLDEAAWGEPPEMDVNFELGRTRKTVLYVSCSSEAWALVDGPVAGQVPLGLAKKFTDERYENPSVGQDGNQSAIEAWQLVLTLLQNALFKNKKGWVKMANPTFAAKIGSSIRASHLMYRLGFGCCQEEDGYRIGPFAKSDTLTEEHIAEAYRYMARVWVEASLSLRAYMETFTSKHPIKPAEFTIGWQKLKDVVEPIVGLSQIPFATIQFPQSLEPQLELFGVTAKDTVPTLELAYDIQVAEDFKNVSKYLGALDVISRGPVWGTESLQIKLATERSLDRYSDDDLNHAYKVIGVTDEHVEAIWVEREELPADYILKMHCEALENAKDNPTLSSDISRALYLIGKERNNEYMMELGRTGGSHLSLDQAYKEFTLSRESEIDNEMLILQYETWINDKPSKADHYRRALSIIANAPGEERPLLQAYLSGRDISEFQGPVKTDIPAGLRNIGNTCYLNSVLQFLYTVKPLREAVMALDQSAAISPEPTDPNEKDKWIKVESSQRFVRLLRELFWDMYATESSAVVPQEDLARLAILPVDLVDQRRDAIPSKQRVTIDSMTTVLSPIHSPASSAAATVADTAPPSPRSLMSSPPSTPRSLSPTSPARPELASRSSILGKRASEDRDSQFGGSEERLRGFTTGDNLIEMDSAPDSPKPVDGDVEMPTPAREGSLLAPGLQQLDIASPQQELWVEDQNDPVAVTPEETEEAMRNVMAPPPLPARPSVAPALQQRRTSLALVAAEKFGLQQDAAEILINVLAQLEYAFDKPAEAGDGPVTNLVQSLFSCKFRQQMLLDSGSGLVQSHPPVENVFVHPIIGVEEEGKDLYDCLAELYLGGAEIEYDGKKGYKMDLLDDLPPLLYIQMRRSQYDFVRGTQTKTNTHIPFPRKLVMDRFLASAGNDKREESINLTRRMMQLRSRRHELKNHKPLAIPETFKFLHDALKDDGAAAMELDDPELTNGLATELDEYSTTANGEISKLDSDLEECKRALETMWEDDKGVEYELVSVFVHGGSGTGGHYWTYQANLPRDGDEFFYYSDDVVKDVNRDEVFSDASAKGVSPALLCYVRCGGGLVETLHRKTVDEKEAEGVLAALEGAGVGTGAGEGAAPSGRERGGISGNGSEELVELV